MGELDDTQLMIATIRNGNRGIRNAEGCCHRSLDLDHIGNLDP